jgi:putative FmdB family regulatory protein
VPIYEYACKKCDHTLDALQKMSDDLLVDCPECGEPALRRLVSAPRFRLKGEGWYETDFKKDNQRNVLKSDTESAKSDKAESKPDKAESKPDKSEAKKTEKKTESKKASEAESK